MTLNTRKRILHHAKKLFAQDGYEGVRTKQIAKAAQVSEVTLFKYFPKKEVLYNTLLDEFYQTLDLTPLVKQLSYANLYDDCLQIAKAVANNLIDNIDIILMRQKEKVEFLSDRKFDIYNDPSYNAMLPMFRTYYERKLISIVPEKAATIFLTSITGSFQLFAVSNFNKVKFLEYIEGFVEIFCNGIEQSSI